MHWRLFVTGSWSTRLQQCQEISGKGKGTEGAGSVTASALPEAALAARTLLAQSHLSQKGRVFRRASQKATVNHGQRG